MEVTDRTLEEILKELLGSSDTLFIVIGCFLLGLIIGIVLTALYFSKLKYYKLKNDLADTKLVLEKTSNERDEFRKKYEEGKKYFEDARGLEYAELALDPDVVPLVEPSNEE